MDLIVQKAVELGAAAICPLLSERTVIQVEEDDAARKQQKWQAVAIEAAKQCGQNWLPKVDLPRSPKEFFSQPARHDLMLIASLQPDAMHLKKLLAENAGKKPKSVLVLVGPEGRLHSRRNRPRQEPRLPPHHPRPHRPAHGDRRHLLPERAELRAVSVKIRTPLKSRAVPGSSVLSRGRSTSRIRRHGLFKSRIRRAGDDLRILGRFVGGVDPCEVLDLAGPRFLVELLRVPLLANFQRRIDEDLDEIVAALQCDLAGAAAVRAVGRDESGNNHRAAVGHEVGHFGDAPDVFHAILGGEAEVRVQAVPDIVAVKDVHMDIAVEEFPLERLGDGRFAGAAQTCEPDDAAAMAVAQRCDAARSRSPRSRRCSRS